MTSPDALLHGSCLCGGIAFHAAQPANDASHCYCTMCQKFHGAAAGSYVNVARAGFVLERGHDLLVEYASSTPGRRGFCSTCGSALYWRSEESPEAIAVALGTLQPPYTGTVTRVLHADNEPSWAPHAGL